MRCWRHGRRRSPPREDTESAAAGPAWRPALGPRRPRPAGASAGVTRVLETGFSFRCFLGGEVPAASAGGGPASLPQERTAVSKAARPGCPHSAGPAAALRGGRFPRVVPREEAFTPHRKHMPMRRHTSGWCGREATCYKDIFLVFKKT